MILTDYYKFEKLAIKSKHRFDCVKSTKSYPELECKRATKLRRATDKFDATNIGDLVIYMGDVPERFVGDVRRKADKSITLKGKNLSSVFEPEPESGLAYGDFKGTTDTVLFRFDGLEFVNGCPQRGGVIEMFIARGMSRDRVGIYNLFEDGALEDEMQSLRDSATGPSDNPE